MISILLSKVSRVEEPKRDSLITLPSNEIFELPDRFDISCRELMCFEGRKSIRARRRNSPAIEMINDNLLIS